MEMARCDERPCSLAYPSQQKKTTTFEDPVVELNPNNTNRRITKIATLFEVPIILGVVGDRKKTDFLYLSNESKGIPSLYRWNEFEKEKQLIVSTQKEISPNITYHPNQAKVVLAIDNNGRENFDLYQLSLTKQPELTRLSKKPIGFPREIFWKNSNQLLLVGYEWDNYYIRLFSLEGEIVELLKLNQPILNGTYVPGKGPLVIARGLDEIGLVLIDVEGGQITQEIPKEKHQNINYPTISREGRLAYACEGAKNDELVIQNLESLEEKIIVPVPGFIGITPYDNWLIQWIDENNLLVVVSKEAQSSLYTLDLQTKQWKQLVTKGSVHHTTISKQGPVWIVSRFNKPTTLQALRAGKIITLFAPPTKIEGITAETIRYASFDNRKIQGWLIKSQTRNSPLVVYCHSGPISVIENTWAPVIHALIVSGFNVFIPNFRGSTTFGSAFRDLTLGNPGGGDLQDILLGAKQVLKELGLTQKPAIMGGSYGGYLVLQALTEQPNEWKGGVALVPVVDWEESYERTHIDFKVYIKHLFQGIPNEKGALFKERSPIYSLSNLKKPLLILQGANDPRCPLEPIQKFYEEAKKLQLPVQLSIAREEGHTTTNKESTIRALDYIITHLKKL